MANSSLIYDGIVSLIEGILPDHIRLPDGYEVGGNDDLSLNQGFSVGFGSGINTQRLQCNKISIVRTYNLRFTKLAAASSSDAIGLSDEQKALMNEAFLVYDELRKTNTLNDITVNINYQTDGGIEFSEDLQHMIINAEVSAEYFE
jgi:hypothetical protein